MAKTLNKGEKTMKSIVKVLTTLSIVCCFFATAAMAADIVGIASGQPGSLGHNTGQAVAKIANQVAKITARTQPLAGTSAYVPVINRGEMSFGFVNAVEMEYAYKGTGNWEGRKNADLRLVGVMFPLITGIAAPAKLEIRSVADLKEKASGLKIASQYTADTTIAYYIMGALANGGMTYDDFKQVPVTNLVKGMEALGNGLVDVALVSLNSGAGKKANAMLSGGIRYISLDDSAEAVKRLKDFMPAASLVTLDANASTPGLLEKSTIIKIPWVMITSKGESEDLVYRMTQVIAENYDKLGQSFGAFKRGSAAQMAPAIDVPYHPGALRYYKEAGIAVGK